LPPGQFGKLTDEQCDPPKSRIGRFLMVIFLAATSVIAGVIRLKGIHMKLLCLTTLLVLTGWLDATASTFELAAVSAPPSNPNQREIELRFTAPEGAEVRVTADGTTVSRTSQGFANAKLLFQLDDDRADGSKDFTFLVGFGSAPNSGMSRTVESDATLNLKLKITDKPTSVPHGKPFTNGHLNGKPITIFVDPKPSLP